MTVSMTLKALRINPNNLQEEAEYLATRPVYWRTPNNRKDRIVKGDYVVYSSIYISDEEGVPSVHDWRPIAVYSSQHFLKAFGRPHGYRGWYLLKTTR